MQFETFSQLVVSVGVVLPRIGAAFLLLPYFAPDTIPPLVRNVFFVSIALVLMPFVLQQPVTASGTDLMPLLLKEIFIGTAIGFTFGIVFWALEGAGQIIDTKIGSTTAQVSDPVTGDQTTLIGSYLARLAAYMFAAFGGLQLFVDLVLSSFQLWPLTAPFPDLAAAKEMFYIERFDELMRISLLLAAPVLCALTLLEVGLGFINRYAPQLNVFTLSLSLKSWLAILILVLTVGNIGAFVLSWLSDQSGFLRALPLGG
jgi:type III secretion protein T